MKYFSCHQTFFFNHEIFFPCLGAVVHPAQPGQLPVPAGAAAAVPHGAWLGLGRGGGAAVEPRHALQLPHHLQTLPPYPAGRWKR